MLAHGLDAVHDGPVLQPADDDVIPPALLVEPAGPVVAGGLDDDDPADGLALVGLVDEQVGERPQEAAGAELEDGFGKGAHAPARLGGGNDPRHHTARPLFVYRPDAPRTHSIDGGIPIR